MSFAPDSLNVVRKYIAEKAGVPGKNISIRAARSNKGYHAGKVDIFGEGGLRWRDPSVRRPRDKAGLSNASSAVDIKLPLKTLKALVAYFVNGAAAGQLDVFEVIGPDADGAATFWSKGNGWEPVHGWQVGRRWIPVNASHEWHMHLSLPRDTEFEDRLAMFKPFFEA